MRYVVEGKPIALQRVRFTGSHCWDSQKDLKRRINFDLETQHDNLPLLSGPLRLVITFYFEISRRAGKQQLLCKSHSSRPDLSNLIKFIEDIATGILYGDDSLIAEIEARKCYDTIARTEFELIQLER